MITDATIPAIHHNVANTHTPVPGVQNDVVNSHTIVSGSHHRALQSSGGQNWKVGTMRTLPVTE